MDYANSARYPLPLQQKFALPCRGTDDGPWRLLVPRLQPARRRRAAAGILALAQMPRHPESFTLAALVRHPAPALRYRARTRMTASCQDRLQRLPPGSQVPPNDVAPPPRPAEVHQDDRHQCEAGIERDAALELLIQALEDGQTSAGAERPSTSSGRPRVDLTAMRNGMANDVKHYGDDPGALQQALLRRVAQPAGCLEARVGMAMTALAAANARGKSGLDAVELALLRSVVDPARSPSVWLAAFCTAMPSSRPDRALAESERQLGRLLESMTQQERDGFLKDNARLPWWDPLMHSHPGRIGSAPLCAALTRVLFIATPWIRSMPVTDAMAFFDNLFVSMCKLRQTPDASEAWTGFLGMWVSAASRLGDDWFSRLMLQCFWPVATLADPLHCAEVLDEWVTACLDCLNQTPSCERPRLAYAMREFLGLIIHQLDSLYQQPMPGPQMADRIVQGLRGLLNLAGEDWCRPLQAELERIWQSAWCHDDANQAQSLKQLKQELARLEMDCRQS